MIALYIFDYLQLKYIFCQLYYNYYRFDNDMIFYTCENSD